MSVSISITSFYCPCSFGKKYHKETNKKKKPTNQLILFMWLDISGLFCLVWSTELTAFLIPHFCNFIVSLDIIECPYPHSMLSWLFGFFFLSVHTLRSSLLIMCKGKLRWYWLPGGLPHPFLLACLSAEVCFVLLCSTSEECGPFLIVQIQSTFSSGFFNTASCLGYPHPMEPSTPTLKPYF